MMLLADISDVHEPYGRGLVRRPVLRAALGASLPHTLL